MYISGLSLGHGHKYTGVKHLFGPTHYILDIYAKRLNAKVDFEKICELILSEMGEESQNKNIRYSCWFGQPKKSAM